MHRIQRCADVTTPGGRVLKVQAAHLHCGQVYRRIRYNLRNERCPQQYWCAEVVPREGGGHPHLFGSCRDQRKVFMYGPRAVDLVAELARFLRDDPGFPRFWCEPAT